MSVAAVEVGAEAASAEGMGSAAKLAGRHAYKRSRRYTRREFRRDRSRRALNRFVLFVILVLLLKAAVTWVVATVEGSVLGKVARAIPYVVPFIDCQQPKTRPVGGIVGVSYTAGAALRDAVTKPPPTAGEIAGLLVGAARQAGAAAGTLQAALRGSPQPMEAAPPVVPVVPTAVATAAGCGAPPPCAPGTPPLAPTPATFTTSRPGAALAASVATQAGFTGADLVTAVAVAGAESGFNPAAVGRNASPPSSDLGMWQINNRAHPEQLATGLWSDPAANARMAYAVWTAAGRSWSPWTTFRDGSYRTWLPAAQQAPGGAVVPAAVCAPSAPAATVGWVQVPGAGNPRTPAQAVAWARAQAGSSVNPQGGDWFNRCLSFLAQAYGLQGSGVPTANEQYLTEPVALQHPGDRNPPAGALVYWRTSNPAGHAALSLGGGMIASTDIPTRGAVGIVPFTAIESQWGGTYVGWAPPYFPAVS